ncbi:MAG TPA: sigma 54-interacting transcriptional regulator [Candidatus Aquilonibacter sp.]|nr:sigma 54-interacting transcriptional regulator [Candidatus Aquilonibacter sp.]
MDGLQHSHQSLSSSSVDGRIAEGAPVASRNTSRYVDVREPGPERHGFQGIVGRSARLLEVLDLVRIVGPTNSTVLIGGETGTGKELIARAIHDSSPRRNRPLIKVNCAAIPSGLIESELFGHERGAFTGALTRRVGRFEAANGGTLYLDEVGELPLELQTKLLRVLQESEFERLGSIHTQRIDVRVIAATNQELEKMIVEKRFRSDLFYRLDVFPITMPSLRERLQDIPPLVRHFVRVFSERINKRIDTVPDAVMDALVRYAWPGNVRELQNFIERSVILTTGNELQPSFEGLRDEHEPSSREPITLEEAERSHIRKTLERTRGIVAGPNGAAARLGMKRSTLYFRMRKLGISR